MTRQWMKSQNMAPVLALVVILASTCGREEPTADPIDPMKVGFLSLFGPRTVRVVVPAGTTFTVALNHGLSSETNAPGDAVRAHVVGDITSDGKLVVQSGAPAYGVVTTAERSGRVKGRARLAFKITSIETVDGSRNVESTMLAGALVAPGTKKRDAATIAGGAAAGAVLGEIIGDKPGVGAVIGGAAGTGVVLSTRGKEVRVAEGARLKFRLKAPLEADVPVERASPPVA